MSEVDRFEAWWKTLGVYDPALKSLAGSAWLEAVRASKPIPQDPHIALMEAEHEDRMQQPAEDPDEWVIQDRVPVRPGTDTICWDEKLHDPQSFGFIETFRGSQSDGKMHGYNADGIFLSVRCRRRDLPKAEQAVCDECGGSSEVDSGGFTPWMAPINVPCGKCSQPEPHRNLGDPAGGVTMQKQCAVDWSYHEKQKPQPQKTMLRLWIDPDCNIHAGLKGDRDLELHYDHETRQFYTEEPS